MKARKKLVVVKENSGARKSMFYLSRLSVQHDHQSEVAVHFVYHCKINSLCVHVGSAALWN